MKNNAIGVFDSGLGGLTALKELCNILPYEDIVYFGDTSRVPYGTRSENTIIRYAKQDINFLSGFDIKAALVACGTISAVALDTIKNDYPFEIIGVIDSAVKKALAVTKNKRIAVLGTNATVRSDAYAKKIRMLDNECEVISIACPLFVPLVENGHIGKNDPFIADAVELYLKKAVAFNADTVILGCTHYPIISHTIGEYVGPDVTLVNSGKEAAKAIKEVLLKDDLLADKKEGKHRFFVSDSADNFESLGGLFMNRSINGDVQKIDIEKY